MKAGWLREQLARFNDDADVTVSIHGALFAVSTVGSENHDADMGARIVLGSVSPYRYGAAALTRPRWRDANPAPDPDDTPASDSADLFSAHLEREREAIVATIPAGWEYRHIRTTYDVDPNTISLTSPLWGVCGHGHVCLTTRGQWLHPFPATPRVCDQHPVIHYVVSAGAAT